MSTGNGQGLWLPNDGETAERLFVEAFLKRLAYARQLNNHRLRLPHWFTFNSSDLPHGFAVLLQQGYCLCGILFADNDYHADAAIEHAMHFVFRDVAFALQPIEQRPSLPT